MTLLGGAVGSVQTRRMSSPAPGPRVWGQVGSTSRGSQSPVSRLFLGMLWKGCGGQRGALHPLCTRAAQGPDWSFWRLLRAGTGGWGAALAHGHTGQPVPEEPVGACDLSLGEQRLCGLWLLALAPTSPGPALAREAWMGSGCQSGTGLLYSATGRFPSQFLRTVASPGTEPEPPPESGVIPWVGLPPAPEMTQEEFL